MAQINIKTTIDDAVKKLDKVHRKQVPFATKNTLNALGQTTKKEIDKQILRRIDRPKSYSKRMMRVDFAKKDKLVARVKVKDTATVTKRGQRGPDQVLGHLFGEGNGSRQLKGMEVLLRKQRILPANRYVVPGEAAPMDAHGNIQTGMINRLLSYFGAFQESGFRANADAKGKKRIGRAVARKVGFKSGGFFVVKTKKPGGLHPGIWAKFRHGSITTIRPILMFVRKPFYRRPLFNIDKTANNIVNRDLNKEFNKAIRHAIATAK